MAATGGAIAVLDHGFVRLDDAMDKDAADPFLDSAFLTATCEHMHFDVAGDKSLGKFPDMSGQAALDQRRVLPGEDQYASDMCFSLL